jgi:hypothetical protein
MKISFTKEHDTKLKELYLELSFSGESLEGKFGANVSSPWDLLHNTALNTLRASNSELKKQIQAQENADEWSLTEYQQTKLARLKKWQEFVNLLIGYKISLAEKDAKSAKLNELVRTRKELEQSTMSPQDQLKALDEEIAKLQSNE